MKKLTSAKSLHCFAYFQKKKKASNEEAEENLLVTTLVIYWGLEVKLCE